jgi:hypothetical protein
MYSTGRWVMKERRLGRSTVQWMAMSTGVAFATYVGYAGFTWLRYGHAKPSSRDKSDAMDAMLDQFMPSYDVAIRDDVRVAAPAEITQQVASGIDIQRLAVARLLFNARSALLGGHQEKAGRSRPLLAWMTSLGWIVLAEIPGRAVVIGTITRPWEADATSHIVPPVEFAVFHEPDYVKITTAWGATPLGSDACHFTLRTRVTTTDAIARRRFRRYWSLFSPGSLLIRNVGRYLIKGQAERQARSLTAAEQPVTTMRAVH